MSELVSEFVLRSAIMDRRQFVHRTSMVAVAIFADWRRLFAQTPKPTPGAIVETKAGRVRGLSIDGVQSCGCGARTFTESAALSPIWSPYAMPAIIKL